MRTRFLFSAAALLLLGGSNLEEALAAGASWAVKKIAGNQWRNGNRLLAEFLGRSHKDIKGLLGAMPHEFQEQYKELAERYADAIEAKEKTTNPATLTLHEEHIEHLKKQAKAMLTKMLGPLEAAPPQGQQGASKGISPIGDAVLDPMQQQLLLLQQRQQQQLQQLIQEMQQSQQAERIRLEQELQLARQQHLAVQREGQAVRSSLVQVQSRLQEVQQRVTELAGSGETIEALTGRLEATLHRVSAAEAEGGMPIESPADLQVLDANIYIQTKAQLGAMLGEVNGALQNIMQQIEQAETKAQQLAEMGSSGKQVSEELLQMCASFHVAVGSQEEYLSEVVSQLEAKQMQCDTTLEKLKAVLDAAFSRYGQSLKANAVDIKQEILKTAENLQTAVSSGAQQLKQQIEREIQRVRSSASPLHVAAQQLQQLQSIASSWNSNLDSSLVSFEHVLHQGQKLLASAAALPPAHGIDTTAVAAALQQAEEVKKLIRKEKAKVTHLVRILEMQHAEAQQQQQQQQLANAQFDPSGMINSDPYGAYALPQQIPRQGNGFRGMQPPQPAGALGFPAPALQQMQQPVGFPAPQPAPAALPPQQPFVPPLPAFPTQPSNPQGSQ